MKRFILFLTMAVFTVIAISSCTCMKEVRPEPLEPQDKHVTIITKYLPDLPDKGKKPLVTPPVVRLKYGTEQQVVWTIDNPKLDFHVFFDKNGSPFEEDHFNNANNKSGKIDKAKVKPPDPNEIFYYYSVKVHGFERIDPVIIIHP